MGIPLVTAATLSSPYKRWSVMQDPPTEPFKLPWPQQRAQIERSFLDLLGEFPTEIPALLPVIKKVAYENGVTRYHVTFQTEENDRVSAWLLVPDDAVNNPTPAIICVHGTTFGSGKDCVIGLAGRRPDDPPRDPDFGDAYGKELAHYGYVTLSIDLLTDGERIRPGERVMDTRGFYRQYPEWSIVGKNIWDVMRSVDFLQTLDFVDSNQIGAMGKSLGGHTVLFASAFEPRLAATMTVGGVLDWQRHTDHWGRPDDTKIGPYIYIKKFRAYIADQTKELTVDFDDLMKMTAPRPLLILSSEQEFYNNKLLPKCMRALELYMNWEDVEGLPSALETRLTRKGYQETLDYYGENYNMKPDALKRMLGQIKAGDCFSWFSFPGGHVFPPVARNYSFAWFDRWLGRTL